MLLGSGDHVGCVARAKGWRVDAVHHFEYGWLTPVMAYGMSFLGSLLGLTCTLRGREAREFGGYRRWLVLASVAIGGTGIWLMHFLAMLGFTVPGSVVRYDVPLTLFSAVIAFVVVGIGLFIVGTGRLSFGRIAAGGLFSGLGVAGMHYTGMAAVHVRGAVDYDRTLVLASVGIAVVAATAALWFTTAVRGIGIVIAAMIMGVAVSGMHYTAMAAVRVHLHDEGIQVSGAEPMTFLLPLVLLVTIVSAGLLFAILGAPTPKEREISARMIQDAVSRR
jgi:NO-binding membrane sensor protein with MHYT domain